MSRCNMPSGLEVDRGRSRSWAAVVGRLLEVAMIPAIPTIIGIASVQR